MPACRSNKSLTSSGTETCECCRSTTAIASSRPFPADTYSATCSATRRRVEWPARYLMKTGRAAAPAIESIQRGGAITMPKTISQLPISTTIGPAELAAGRAYVHDAELVGDEVLAVGMRVEICDQAGRIFAASVTARD